ncbi:unnamed protein product [Cylicocyclus nassatus]|uniref:RNA-directed DNA polymerase n=1 Tax=Cylicocyclus nassatus TaxID=53992 RepID=A0AA36M2N9_CYLNA|nr:unnamed protein product [Cylicocyclus nassatus]
MKFILIPEHELAFEFSDNHMLRAQLLQHCTITNSYLTTSNHIISFPNIPSNTMVQDFILESSYNFKRKREVKYLTDTENRQSRYELVPPQTLPIAERIFGSTDFQKLPPFETQPITDILLLREIKLWNITNADFLRRSRMYEIENIRINTLRTIRYAEYRYRQIAWLRSIETKRPLNYAERSLLQDLEQGITDVFDKYLSDEFGILKLDINSDPANLKGKPSPYFQAKDLEKENVTNQIEADPFASIERERLKSTTPRPSTIAISTAKTITKFPTTTTTTSKTTTSTTTKTAPTTSTLSPITRSPVIIPPVHVIPETKSLNPIGFYTTTTTKPTTTTMRVTTTIAATTVTAMPSTTKTSTTKSTTTAKPTTTSSTAPPTTPVLSYEKLIPLPPSESVLLPLHKQSKRTNHVSSPNSDDNRLDPANIRREFNSICVRQYLNNQKLHELSHADPTWAARTLLGTSDVVATLTDNELLVSRCRKVEPTEVHSNHQVNQTCYELLPVLVEEQLWFAIPGTGDLVQSATETPCPYITNLNGQIQPMLPPNMLLSDNAQPFIFNSPPIYHHIMKSYAPTVRFQIDALQQEYLTLQNRLQKRGIIDDALLQIKNVKNSIGDSLTSIYDKTTSKLTNGIESIRWSLISLLLWITIPALVGIILVATCICCVKLYFIRKASSTAASAMFELASNFTPKRRIRNRPEVNALFTELPSREPLFVPRIYAIPFATNHVQNPLPYVRISLNHLSTPALIDSGATISYMKQSTLYALGPNITIENNNVKAQAANGSPIELLGSVNVNVNIGTHSVPHRFLVSHDHQCPAPVLLGTDFIKKLNQQGLKITIDLHNNLLTIGSDSHNVIQINAINFLEVKPQDVRLLHTTILPKRSSSIVPAFIDNYSPNNPFDFIIEDNQREIDLLKEGIRPNPEKTRAIDDYPTPRNPTDIKAFLGMCSFFRRFVHKFAAIASPLTALTKKDAPFIWTAECEDAMRRLKEALTTAPILVAPKLGLPFVIETDSSGKAVAGVLKQEQDEHLKVIAYASRTLNVHESRYPAIELEALGVVFAVQKFRPYIDGAKCTVITDHAPLKALLHRKDLTGRLAKYQIILQEFDITITYRPGKANVVCDTLSRHPPQVNATQTGTNTESTIDLSSPDIIDRIKEEQNKTPWIASYKQAIENDEPNPYVRDYIILNEDSDIKKALIKQVHESRFGTAHLDVTSPNNNLSPDILLVVPAESDVNSIVSHSVSSPSQVNDSNNATNLSQGTNSPYVNDSDNTTILPEITTSQVNNPSITANPPEGITPSTITIHVPTQASQNFLRRRVLLTTPKPPRKLRTIAPPQPRNWEKPLGAIPSLLKLCLSPRPEPHEPQYYYRLKHEYRGPTHRRCFNPIPAPLCLLCSQSTHLTRYCQSPMPFHKRARILLQRYRLCPRCLESHPLKECTENPVCFRCNATGHVTAICQDAPVTFF